MKKILIVASCGLLLLAVLSLKESRLEIDFKSDGQTLEAKDKETTLLFVGDIMLGRNVENLMNKYGQDYPFDHIKDLLNQTDGVVANLEGPIMSPSTHTLSMSTLFSFASSTAALLAKNNIKLVSQANNHGYDYGLKGYEQTREFLSKAGVLSVGHPYIFSDAYITRLTENGLPILFVAFNLTSPNFESQKAIDFVKKLERKPGEFLVAIVHGGDEYALHSNVQQQFLYRGLIEAGTDLVIAHHPHVVEEVELYKNKLIFYSLGNFIFDQYFSQDAQEGLAVTLTLSKTEARYELVPTKSVRSQPQVMANLESKKFLENLAARSPTAGKLIRAGEIDLDR